MAGTTAQIVGTPPDSLAVDSLLADEEEYDISDARMEYFIRNAAFHFIVPDTGLNRLEDFDPAFRGWVAHQTLGNTGLATQPLLFGEAGSRGTVGFDLAADPFLLYRSGPDSVRYYRVNKPFTRVRYVLGSGVQQILGFRHARNLFPNLNTSVDYTRYVSVGQSSRQKAGVHDMGLSAWYRTRNQRLAWTFSYSFQDVQAEENGGAAVDSVFTFTPREAAPIQLDNALTEQRRQSVRVRTLLFGGTGNPAIPEDSLANRIVVPRWQAWHEFGWMYDDRQFTDANPDTTYYPEFLFDPDSIQVQYSLIRLENSIGLSSSAVAADSLPPRWGWKLQLTHRYDRIQETAGYRREQDVLGEAAVQYLPGRDTSDASPLLDLSALVNRRGEVQSKALAGWQIRQHYVLAGIGFQRWQPNAQQLFFFSAPYFWNTSLPSEQHFSPEFRYGHRKAGFHILLRYNRVQDLLYYNEQALPRAAAQAVTIWQALLRQDFTFGRWHLDNLIALQRNSGDELRLPLYIGLHSFYYESYFFEEALFARIGLDIRYQSTYTADAWNPVTATFYRQNTISPDTYPVLDLFFAAQIDQARIFLKGVNLTQGLFAPGWYQTANYPMPNRGLVLGIDWRFWY